MVRNGLRKEGDIKKWMKRGCMYGGISEGRMKEWMKEWMKKWMKEWMMKWMKE